MNVYQRKVYAFLQSSRSEALRDLCDRLRCLQSDHDQLEQWWSSHGSLISDIASSSDRVNLEEIQLTGSKASEVCHPINGHRQTVGNPPIELPEIPEDVLQEADAQTVFWWFWRFYPALFAEQDAFLSPAHRVLPDCSIYSYQSTCAALAGALFPDTWVLEQPATSPYILLFTFTPIQEFIKASRKFLNFWSGSYMLHYLGAALCWQVAKMYGPDAIITPSLWGQEIIDAWLVQQYPEFEVAFSDGSPVKRFETFRGGSLSTAGFPNIMTVLVPGKDAAIALAQELSQTLATQWQEIARNVREDIKKTVQSTLQNGGVDAIWQQICNDFPSNDTPNPYYRELQQLQQAGCWEWNSLWDAQIDHSWETYHAAIPLGHPDKPLRIAISDLSETWIQAQADLAQPRTEIPTLAEKTAYHTLNVGSWWGSYQARLGRLIPTVKNTRNWRISVAPGGRSTLSGQYSALHPRFNYQKFHQGRGMPASSLRLFWRVMALIPGYRGIFNGFEQLNAIELTKRMAWKHGRVAESLGIPLQDDDFENLIRFPNLSAIAAARFAKEHPKRILDYWTWLSNAIAKDPRLAQKHAEFCSRTRRPFQILQVDSKLQAAAAQSKAGYGKGYNGVMFSSKWLADDMRLKGDEIHLLRALIDQAHQQNGFGAISPSDWWVLVLADGDGMGEYVTGNKLKPYEHYLVQTAIHERCKQVDGWNDLLEKTKKRMSPATHIGFNRALLDFSNRIVPYLTEQRFCGRVIYSGGDDVMAVLPLADLPGYLRSLRAAWCGGTDPEGEFENRGDYWYPQKPIAGILDRPLFTMGTGATMSLGIVIAHKSVPLPTVLENVWEAEKHRAKKLAGKDGLCFRVIYGSGNTLEALMKGHLLEDWWSFVQAYQTVDLSPLLYRLAEELPRHADVTESNRLFEKVIEVIVRRRSQPISSTLEAALIQWVNAWEDWIKLARAKNHQALGTTPEDLANLLKFSAFWISRQRQEMEW